MSKKAAATKVDFSRIATRKNGGMYWDVIVPLIVRVKPDPTVKQVVDKIVAHKLATTYVEAQLKTTQGIDLQCLTDINECAPLLCDWDAKERGTWDGLTAPKPVKKSAAVKSGAKKGAKPAEKIKTTKRKTSAKKVTPPRNVKGPSLKKTTAKRKTPKGRK